jgi:uncharacterized membrane protein
MDGSVRTPASGRFADRPQITLERTGIDAMLDGLALAGWMSGLAAILFTSRLLPDRLPVHFDLAGNPDRWGTRLELFVPSGISLVLFIGLVLLTRIPHTYSYIVEITPKNAPRQYGLAVRLLRSLNVLMQWLFAAITWTIIRAAQGSISPGVWLIPILVAGTFVLLIVYLVKASSDPTPGRPS